MSADLNTVLWRCFEDNELRERCFANGISETLREEGVSDEHIALFEKGDIQDLLDIGLVPRGALRWGTFWLKLLAERRKRGVRHTLDDLYKMVDAA